MFLYLQDQQQAQGHQQLLVRPLPEEKVEDGQKQQVPGVQAVQVKLVQQPPEQTGEAVPPAIVLERRDVCVGRMLSAAGRGVRGAGSRPVPGVGRLRTAGRGRGRLGTALLFRRRSKTPRRRAFSICWNR